jgi:hypothetical protein
MPPFMPMRYPLSATKRALAIELVLTTADANSARMSDRNYLFSRRW